MHLKTVALTLALTGCALYLFSKTGHDQPATKTGGVLPDIMVAIACVALSWTLFMGAISNGITTVGTWAMDLWPTERQLTPELKKSAAYHEAGHTVVAWFDHEHPGISHVTIRPDADSDGRTRPKASYVHLTPSVMRSNIRMTLGGRAIDEILYGQPSTGSHRDIAIATDTAKEMVFDYGFSAAIGIRYLSDDDVASEAVLRAADQEIKSILSEELKNAKSLVTKHKDDVEKVTAALLQHETLDEKDLVELLGERPTALPQSSDTDRPFGKACGG